jgi:hypothetical protein
MRNLTFSESTLIAGATYGLCSIDDPWGLGYAADNPITIDYNYQSPWLIFSQAIAAAFIGCGAGIISGKGPMGCAIGGGAAAASKTLSYFVEDAYWMYQAAK